MARFILSRKKVLEQYSKLKKHCDRISYSWKTNQEVGNVLNQETVCEFSVHSIKSVQQISSIKRIWFFLQAQKKDDILTILESGVSRFVVDNRNDLGVLMEAVKQSGKKIDLLLRMRLKEHTIHTGKHFVYGMFSDEVNVLLKELSENDYIDRLGIHFHRKTQNVSEWSLLEELKNSISSWDCISIVNIGGGLPAEYKNFRKSVLDMILENIDELRIWLNEKGVEMMIEPGRFIAAPSVKLETEIINIYGNNIVVDASIFNGAIDTWIANIRLLVEREADKGEAYTIKGCSPDSSDILRYRVYLEKPEVGDKVVFLNAGAYNFYCDFCNLKRISTEIEA